MDKKKIISIFLSFWGLIILGWVFQSEYTINTGKEILLETVPVDPRDMLMGDYVILNYEIGQLPTHFDIEYATNKKVFVSLELDENNIAHIKNILTYKPDNELYLQGTLCPSSHKCINYGIENYYVKEKSGRTLEYKLRHGTLVRVAVNKKGKAKVIGFENTLLTNSKEKF